MPNAVENFEQGAEILQQVDVSEIFTSMAMGIAQAQEKLDNNSIAQIIRLSEQEVAGKSLLELGFIPAFYSFSYVDISCNINLQMALKTDLSIGLSAKLDIAKKKGYSEEDLKYLEENRDDKSRKEFKSSREFMMRAKEDKSIKIEEQSYKMNQTEGSVSMIEDFKEKLLKNENISRVYSEVSTEKTFTEESGNTVIIRQSGGYITIALPYIPPAAYGILKITNYTKDPAIDINGTTSGGDFSITNNFENSFNSANSVIGSGTIYGFTKDGLFYNATKHEKLNIYFGWNKDKLEYSYSGPEPTDSEYNGSDSYSNINLKDKLLRLAQIMIKDPVAILELIGYTDSSGPDNYNTNLGKRRAENIKSILVSMGVPESQITTSSKGETDAAGTGDNKKSAKFRIVEFMLDADYIYFEGGNLTSDAAPAPSSPLVNKFIWKGTDTAVSSYLIKFKVDTNTYEISGVSSISAKEADIKTEVNNEYYLEVIDETAYLLHKEAKIKYMVYSSNNEVIKMETEKSSSSNENIDESTYLIEENTNSSSLLSNEVSKLDGSNSFALSAAIDFRMSRQFDMSMQGNASMSARLVAVPPPKRFEDAIINNLIK